jgi:hypothetical protein
MFLTKNLQFDQSNLSFFKILDEKKDSYNFSVSFKQYKYGTLFLKLTGFFRALRRKKALQLSHTIAPKLYPFAVDPQTTQINVP